MARNRKSQAVPNLLGPALKALLLCAVIGGSGVGYVWQKTQIVTLGQQKRQAEIKLMDLQHQNKMRRDHLDKLRLPWMLEMRIKEWNLGLVRPQPEQILRLTEPTTPAPRQAAELQAAGPLARLETRP